MPIVRKKVAEKHLKRFDERVSALRAVLSGTEPNENLADLYALNMDDYKRDFVEINAEDLAYAIADIQTSAKELKKAGALKADKLHKSR